MGSLWCSICLLVLGLVGAQSAALSNQKLSFKTPGALRANGSAPRLGIYHGQSTSIKNYPYLAAVAYDNDFMGAATIISEDWVLMSADSIYGAEPSSLSVIVDSNDGTSGKKYLVKEVVTHPNYGTTFLDYDFGLLKIKGKFKWSKTVKKAKLPKKAAKAGSEGVVVGWGDTVEGKQQKQFWGIGVYGSIRDPDSNGGSLREGKMKFLSNKQCDKLYEALGLTLTDRMGCTYNKGKVTPCTDDWSDPTIQSGTVYQMFIAVATSGECSSSAYPAINADVFSVVKWIKKIAKIGDDEDDE